MGEAEAMADAHDSTAVDEEGAHEHPGEGEPVGGHDDDHGHGHDDDHGHGHGHDDHDAHGSGGDAWVLIPAIIGLVIGLVIAASFGLASGVSPF